MHPISKVSNTAITVFDGIIMRPPFRRGCWISTLKWCSQKFIFNRSPRKKGWCPLLLVWPSHRADHNTSHDLNSTPPTAWSHSQIAKEDSLCLQMYHIKQTPGSLEHLLQDSIWQKTIERPKKKKKKRRNIWEKGNCYMANPVPGLA